MSGRFCGTIKAPARRCSSSSGSAWVCTLQAASPPTTRAASHDRTSWSRTCASGSSCCEQAFLFVCVNPALVRACCWCIVQLPAPAPAKCHSLSAAFIGSVAWRQHASNLQTLGLRGDFGRAGQTGIRVLPNTGMWLELGMLVGPPCPDLDLDLYPH